MTKKVKMIPMPESVNTLAHILLQIRIIHKVITFVIPNIKLMIPTDNDTELNKVSPL